MKEGKEYADIQKNKKDYKSADVRVHYSLAAALLSTRKASALERWLTKESGRLFL